MNSCNPSRQIPRNWPNSSLLSLTRVSRSWHLTRGDAPEVGRFLLWFAALADSSITMFARRWINKNNHNIFLPTSCRSLCLSLDSVLPAIYVSLPLKTAIFAFSSSPPPLSHLCLSPPLLHNPKTKPLSPIHHKTLVREGLAMQNGSNSAPFCI